MDTLIHCAFKALRSMLNGKIIFILAISIAINLLIILGIASLVIYLIGEVTWSWLPSFLLGAAPYFIGGMISFFFFPLLLPLIVSFFSENVASAIEKEDYPAVTSIERPFWQEVRLDLLFTLKVIGINLLILPLYLIPGINLFIYYLVNGSLVGAEFFSMAARRHVPLADVKAIRRKFRGRIFLCGISIVIATTFPILNFLSPIWGMALMVHLYQELKKLAAQPELLQG